ncbi:MAG TPA: carboxypeptidase-like regulatory domain-containing protein, partial [Vicinamibacterales bacterium]|nr:carboxypeptidase-like regulatory domain-containing protein [Vicinamibacterales bacterium]
MNKQFMAIAVVTLLLAACTAFAQEASVTGVVADSTKAVLPGVTVTATSLETGAQAIAVTGERGEYRLPPLSPGVYKLEAALPGFATVTVDRLELLVGQNAAVPFTLNVGQIAETLVVTGEAPLVDTSSSQVSGNVDRRQMEQLPLQGRNWMELSKLVKGVTANDVGNSIGTTAADDLWQLNLDGQQITQKIANSGFGQPRFSREAISEFQIVTNLFDVTQGRSAGIQIQAITKSGTNTTSGSGYGFFRDDSLNAPDPVAHTVLPYSNQQLGGSLGGP